MILQRSAKRLLHSIISPHVIGDEYLSREVTVYFFGLYNYSCTCNVNDGFLATEIAPTIYQLWEVT